MCVTPHTRTLTASDRVCCVILFTCRFGAEQVGAVLEPLVQTDTCADTHTHTHTRLWCCDVCVRAGFCGSVCVSWGGECVCVFVCVWRWVSAPCQPRFVLGSAWHRRFPVIVMSLLPSLSSGVAVHSSPPPPPPPPLPSLSPPPSLPPPPPRSPPPHSSPLSSYTSGRRFPLNFFFFFFFPTSVTSSAGEVSPASFLRTLQMIRSHLL